MIDHLDDFGRNYLRLVLEINKHIDGYVNAYIGPPDLKAKVEAGEQRSIEVLFDDLARLQAAVPTDDPDRRAWLSAALRAMDCTLRMQKGESFEYVDEVRLLYDIEPELVNEARFTAAHQELDTLLPGKGSLDKRSRVFRQRYELPTDKLLSLLELTLAEVQRRTLSIIDLVPGEGVELRLVENQPWGAYNWFLGNARSRIEFNTSVPVLALMLTDLLAHEVYPGHHTELQLKEKNLYQQKGYVEYAALLLHSPAAVISEGIATTAIEMIFTGNSHHEWNAEVLFPAAGLENHPPELILRIEQARKVLHYVTGNAAILYHTGKLDRDQTIEYVQTYGLFEKDRAEQAFKFISSPLFRSYVFTYTQGHELIERAAGNGDKLPLFKRLLTEQILPSELAAIGRDN